MRILNTAIGSKKVYTVSEITARVKDLLEGGFPYLWVVGEVSNCSIHSSGHIYFTLKDESAQLRCVLFSGSAQQMSILPENGLKIHAQGRLTVYERQGQYELIVNTMLPVGKGDLYIAFNRLKERLEKEGLFAAERKKELPRFPSRIGLVTSPTGAAVRDVTRIARKIFAAIEIVIYPVKVQGEGAKEEITEAINQLNSMDGVDVIILARGGGSIEDLWAFNEEMVARAISDSRIPVVSAVGHEIDFTIADFVADARAATPSAAPTVTLAGYVDARARMDSLPKQAKSAISSSLERYRDFLSSLSTRYGLRRIKDRIFAESRNLDEVLLLAGHSIEAKLEGERGRLASLVAKVESLDPLSTLSRGYSVCFREDTGVIVKSHRQICAGDHLRIRFSDGGAVCQVERTEEDMF